MRRVAVGVMARAPSQPGKTRLTDGLSASRLRSLRAALLADTLGVVTRAPSVDPFIFFTPEDSAREIAALAERPMPAIPQQGRDLGERMHAAIEHVLVRCQYAAAILVGTDIPFLTPQHIADAIEMLVDNTIVFGPAADGGYYLIGMTSPRRELFERIEWGTESVLTDTLRIADRLGVEARLIRSTYDIDATEDVLRLERDLLTAPGEVAPNVRRWFTERG